MALNMTKEVYSSWRKLYLSIVIQTQLPLNGSFYSIKTGDNQPTLHVTLWGAIKAANS